MATIFWDRKGPLLVNFFLGDPINAAVYCETLKKLRRAIQNKPRGVWLLQDNAHPHTARTTQELLQSFKWEVLANPPHSPDLAPSNYHLFSKLKETLAGKTFSDDDEVQDLMMTWLREQAGDFYNAGIKQLISRLTKCNAIHGDYAEK
jgi:transposase